MGLMLVTHWNHGKHKSAMNMAYFKGLVTSLKQNGKSRHLSLRRANRGPDKWEHGPVAFSFSPGLSLTPFNRFRISLTPAA